MGRRSPERFDGARLLAWMAVASSCWTTPAGADAITLDGDPIDGRAMRLGGLYLLDRSERCPPTSDALLRERIVENLLLQREHIRLLELSDSADSRKRLEQYAIRERNIEESLEAGFAYRAAIYHYPADHYDFARSVPVRREEIEAEYERMVAARHPLVIDAVAVKFRAARGSGDEQIRRIADVFESGGDIGDMRGVLGHPADGPLDGSRWIPVIPAGAAPVPDFDGQYWSDRVPGWSPGVKTGQVLGPEVRWLNPAMTTEEVLSHTYYEIIDRRRTDRIELRGGPDELRGFAALWIERVLEKRQFDTLRHRLRAEADVRVDGVPVSADVTFEVCPAER